MGMPEIPDGKNRPSMKETIIDLFESIALEEMAISHILNSQGEHLQAIIGKFRCSEISLCDVNIATRSTHQMLVDLIMKEWLLLNKFNYVNDLVSNQSIQFYNCNENANSYSAKPAPEIVEEIYDVCSHPNSHANSHPHIPTNSYSNSHEINNPASSDKCNKCATCHYYTNNKGL